MERLEESKVGSLLFTLLVHNLVWASPSFLLSKEPLFSGRTIAKEPHLPELKALLRKDKAETVLPASKWAREDDESDDGQEQSSRGLDLGYSSGSENAGYGSNKNDEMEFPTDASMSSQPESGLNEEQRQKLRRLEVALMEYRESLEERAVRSPEEIERKVAIYRKRLQSEYGLSDSNEDVSLNSNE
ncbi:hypothetical protein Nepgr_012501 [Nepenthes gracilis]|uniref:CWF21 domain-containing protein n=1 Tax=Nepenthes gracilis TaxID=150966 RepID=A0AAD3SH18_NEPGR|nr:hypothetical protein Nepgr_012501 [Nepenthes gracilis]